MAVCVNCGEVGRAGATFCTKCGGQIAEQAIQQPTAPAPVASPPPLANAPTNSGFSYPLPPPPAPREADQTAPTPSQHKPPVAGPSERPPTMDRLTSEAAARSQSIDLVRWTESLGKSMDPVLPRLATGEELKRQWLVTRSWRPLSKSMASVTLTDARIVCVSDYISVVSSHRNTSEIRLDDIAGVETELQSGLRGWRIPLLVMLAGGSLSSFIDDRGLLGIGLLIAALLLFVFSLLNRRVALTLLRKGAGQGGHVVIGIPDLGLLGRIAEGVLNLLTFPITLILLPLLGISDLRQPLSFTPTADGHRMCSEVGAAILDLQNRGVVAGE